MLHVAAHSALLCHSFVFWLSLLSVALSARLGQCFEIMVGRPSSCRSRSRSPRPSPRRGDSVPAGDAVVGDVGDVDGHLEGPDGVPDGVPDAAPDAASDSVPDGSEAADHFDECPGSSGTSSGSWASCKSSGKAKAGKGAKAKGGKKAGRPADPKTNDAEVQPSPSRDDMEDDDADMRGMLTHVRLMQHRLYAVLAAGLVLAWLVGAAGGSLAWVLLLLVVLATSHPFLSKIIQDVVRGETARVRVRRALAHEESAEWINFLLNRWCAFSANALVDLLKERLEPLLNEARPSIVESLELRQVCLGSKTPILSGLRATEVVGGRHVPVSLASMMRSGTAGTPGLAPRHRVALQGRVELHPCEDFRCVLRTRLFGKGMGMDLDIAVERLNLDGNVLVTFTLDLNAPFPHVTRLSFTFLEEPHVWFSVRMLKSVQAMEVPLLKSWIHSIVLDAFVTSMVDPGHLDVVLMAPDCPRSDKDAADNDSACGVLTIGLSLNMSPAGQGEPRGEQRGSGPEEGGGGTGGARWLVVTLGSERRTCHLLSPTSSSSTRTDRVSFLVSAAQLLPQAERLQVKLKSKRLVGALTLAQYELALYGVLGEDSPSDCGSTGTPAEPVLADALLHRRPTRTSAQMPIISARLEYTPLPPMTAMTQPVPADQQEQPMSNGTDSQQGGVLYVVVHGAERLSPSDQNECNPYCMIFNNREKVKTTHYMRGTTSPTWESRTQLLVPDFSQTSLSFIVCSWSSAKMADTDLLGVAVLNLINTERKLIRRQLTLTGNRSSDVSANITVSVVFHPVASVSASSSKSRQETGSIREKDRQRPASPDQRNIDEFSTFSRGSKRNSNTWMHQAKMLLTHKDNESVSDISNLLSNGQGLIEVTFVKARDLVAKDLNGFSDPYCEVRVNGECKYKTSIKKKTLNPIWEESTITGMPHHPETLDVLLWDHDIFGMKDFLGSVTFTCDEIRRCSAIDAPQWFQLQNTKSGSVEMKVKVISDIEMESCSSYAPSTAASVNSCTSSPRLPTKMESDRDSNYSFKPIIRRPSKERSRLKLHADPPPPPPRTVTLQNKAGHEEAASNTFDKSWNSSEMNNYKLNGNGALNSLNESALTIGHWSPAHSATSSPLPVPRLLVTSPHSVHSSPGRFSLRASKPFMSSLSPNGTESNFETNDESPFKKGNEYSSLRIMKQKVKQGLRLRRFRSEINFLEDKNGKNGASGISLSLQPRSEEEADASDLMHGEPLSHAVSQPSLLMPKPKRPTDLKGLASPRPDAYVGVEGKVLQAQGLHVAHVAQLYCRVKLQTAVSPEKQTRLSSNTTAGKTVGKSRLLPAVPNPRFDLHFQLDSSSPISRQAGLLFEIRSASKDIVASRRITLQDLLSAAAPDTNEVHTWLALNNGASLEVEVAHGRDLKKPARKLFRSWSVHRIGKI